MKFLLVTLALVFQVFAQADTLSIPKIFEDGEVAEAADFNQNFEYLRQQIDTNGSWLNTNVSGSKEVPVDCSSNQDALRLAYHANVHVRHVNFQVTGTCLGAIHYIPMPNDDGTFSWGEIQPMNQVITIGPPEGITARISLIPRTAHGISKTGIYSSFGNGLYVNGVDIQMGADDNWGLLFSRNSNGGAQDTTITGVGSATGAVIQYGGSVYFGGLTVSDVAYGIVGVNAGSMRVTSPISLTASNTALYLSGGQWTGGGVALIATTGNALILDNAAHAAVKTGEVKGAIKVSSGSIGKINYEGQGGFDADVQILDSNLTLITAAGSNPAYDISRFTCNGMSFLNIDTVNVRNDGGNHCLDDTGWNAVIDATFP
ncbi:hypothetical protein N8137_02835 [Porticoccaceae bacterium]|nr:hypothetical protein [Porticoccaceae bacterium]